MRKYGRNSQIWGHIGFLCHFPKISPKRVEFSLELGDLEHKSLNYGPLWKNVFYNDNSGKPVNNRTLIPKINLSSQ